MAPHPTALGKYFDHNGSTPLHPRVWELCASLLDEVFGDTAASHSEGRKAREVVERARLQLALTLNASADELCFTSGGTESNNWALLASAAGRAGGHLVVSSIEHESVLEAARELERRGFDLTCVDPRADGAVHLRDLQAALRDDTFLVSVMWANHETGVMQPVREIGALCRKRGIRFHTDAATACGKLPIDLREIECDLLSLSAHKLYAPKGVGLLFIREGVDLPPLHFGSGQQNGRRSGMENAVAIAGFGEAAKELSRDLEESVAAVETLRQQLWHGIQDRIPGAQRNGAGGLLPNTLNVFFPGASSSELQGLLARDGFSVGAGGSTSSGASHVLLAMGLDEERASQSLRFSLGISTTAPDVEHLLEHLVAALDEARAVNVAH